MLETQRMQPVHRMLVSFLRNTSAELARRGAFGQHEATRSWCDHCGFSCHQLLGAMQRNGIYLSNSRDSDAHKLTNSIYYMINNYCHKKINGYRNLQR